MIPIITPLDVARALGLSTSRSPHFDEIESPTTKVLFQQLADPATAEDTLVSLLTIVGALAIYLPSITGDCATYATHLRPSAPALPEIVEVLAARGITVDLSDLAQARQEPEVILLSPQPKRTM